MEKESIIRKIKGLLELAAHNPETNEAKLAGERAAKLMADYQISYIKEDILDNKLIKRINSPVYMKRNIVWEHILITQIAYTFDCKAVRTRIGEDKYEFAVIGYKVDAELCEWYFKYLRTVISKKGEDKYKKLKERKSYQLGLVDEICHRLIEIKKQKEKHTDVGTKDLVLSKLHNVNDHYEKMFPKTKKNKSKLTIEPDAYSKGYKDGKNISLSRPIVKGKSQESIINGKVAIG